MPDESVVGELENLGQRFRKGGLMLKYAKARGLTIGNEILINDDKIPDPDRLRYTTQHEMGHLKEITELGYFKANKNAMQDLKKANYSHTKLYQSRGNYEWRAMKYAMGCIGYFYYPWSTHKQYVLP